MSQVLYFRPTAWGEITGNINSQTDLALNYVKIGGNSIGAVLQFGTNDNNDVRIKSNSSTVLTLTTSGDVGIRKTDPKSSLHIFGTGAKGAGGYVFFGDSFGNTTTPRVSIGENGITDTDQMEIYALQGIFMRTGAYGSTSALHISSVGRIGLGTESPTAKLQLQASAPGIDNSSLKIPAGTPGNLANASDGAVDYDGVNYYACVGTTRYQIARVLTGSAVLDFPNTAAAQSSDLTITVIGAAAGDSVSLGVPPGSKVAFSNYTAICTAADTVTVTFNNYSLLAINPPSGTFKATVLKNI